MIKTINNLFGIKKSIYAPKYQKVLSLINNIADEYKNLTDDELREKTNRFKNFINHEMLGIQSSIKSLQEKLFEDDLINVDEIEKVQSKIYKQISELENEGRKKLKTALDKLLPYAYAAIKETCRRLVGKHWTVCDQEIEWDMVPFDVQVLAAIALNEGIIIEMATGEGKTLVATMPLYLNALIGKGVHLVTTNDYLVRRDCEWMGMIYEFLGLKTAYITNEMTSSERRKAYEANITYATNNELAFDYLRDNMVIRKEDLVQRGHFFAILDDVDMVLIDEARTPHIISGPVAEASLASLFEQLKLPVELLISNQQNLIENILDELERQLGLNIILKEKVLSLLFQVNKGDPKNKRLMKLLEAKRVLAAFEEYKDSLNEDDTNKILNDLYYFINEENHCVELTFKGQNFLTEQNVECFVLLDYDRNFGEIDNNFLITSDEKENEKGKIRQHNLDISNRLMCVSQLLKAYLLFSKDVDYVVADRKVIIVDEFTGRLKWGSRYSDGLHQALEAKEGVDVQDETKTLATITVQNYFRLYSKLSGMTGTAMSESIEFKEVYGLSVLAIPTHEPVRRIDYEDQIYRTKREKFNAIINDIAKNYERKSPVLVGTTTIENSEILSRMLNQKGIPHSVLNAKYHKREADIIARAGTIGAVTIATNMAGRGTDIKLQKGTVMHHNCALAILRSDSEVCPHLTEFKCIKNVPCGLHIIGTERHESRRIDQQLRGRCGRQGDPGSSCFYLSLEDDLMRLFGSDRVARIMDKLGCEEGEVITHKMVTRSIERAQKRVELQNFAIRKRLLEYDDVLDYQRQKIYEIRNRALAGHNMYPFIIESFEQLIENKIADWRSIGLDLISIHDEARKYFRNIVLSELIFPDEVNRRSFNYQDLMEFISEIIKKKYQQKESKVTKRLMRELERLIILRVVDEKWQDYLHELDYLRETIHLKTYIKQDPLIEYKKKATELFSSLIDEITEYTLELVFKTNVIKDKQLPSEEKLAQQDVSVYLLNNYDELQIKFIEKDVIESFIDNVRHREADPEMPQLIRSDIGHFISFLPSKFSQFHQIPYGLIVEFVQICRHDGVLKKVIDRKINNLKLFFDFLEKQHYISRSPFKKGIRSKISEKVWSLKLSKSSIKKLITMLMLLAIYRIGIIIPLPFINRATMPPLISNRNFFLRFWDTFILGGAIENLSIFALGIIPYFLANTLILILYKGGKKTSASIRLIIINTIITFILSAGFSLWLTKEGLYQPTLFNYLIISCCLTIGSLASWGIFVLMDKYGFIDGHSTLLLVNSSVYFTTWLLDQFRLRLFYSIPIFLIIIGIFLVLVAVELAEKRIRLYTAQIKPGAALKQASELYLPISFMPNTTIFYAAVVYLTCLIYAINGIIHILGFSTPGLTAQSFVTVILFYIFFCFSIFGHYLIKFKPVSISRKLQIQHLFIPNIKSGKETVNYLENFRHELSYQNILIYSLLFFAIYLGWQILPSASRSNLGYDPIMFFLGIGILVDCQIDFLKKFKQRIFVEKSYAYMEEEMMKMSILEKAEYMSLILEFGGNAQIFELLKLSIRNFLLGIKQAAKSSWRIAKKVFGVITIVTVIDQVIQMIKHGTLKEILPTIFQVFKRLLDSIF